MLPLDRMTILFGANDSGKSTTLRVVAQRLDELMRGSRARGDCTAIMSFRHDREALEVLLGELMQQERSPTESTWTLDTLADRPRLFGVDDPAVAAQLAEAPAFALSLPSAEDVHLVRAERWAVTLVRSPAHAAEIGKELLAALERRRRSYQVPLPPDAVDLARFGPPLRPHHEEPIGETALPLVPQPLSLPAGIGVALEALDAAVDRARRAFRSWAEKAELPVRLDPIEAALVNSCDDSGAWVGPDGEPDLFLLQLTGDLEVESWSSMPPFANARYRLDFDASSLPQDPWATRLNARICARRLLRGHRTFAEKFPADQIASGFRLWTELAIWDLVAKVDAAAASLWVASCDELVAQMEHGNAPTRRLRSLRERWLDPRREGEHVSWLPAPEERAWQLHVLASASRTPRTEVALDACARAVRPRVVLIDEPERHLNAAVAADAAHWLQQRVRDTHLQVVLATHSPAFLACRGDDVRHVHVDRGSEGLVYTSFSPTDQDAVATIARTMKLSHGELFGLANAIVWVEGPTDRAVLDVLCGDELRATGAHIAMFGGLGNIQTVLDNPLSRLPNLRFVLMVDALDTEQLAALRTNPAQVAAKASHELRGTADLLRRARAEDRQLEVVSHGAADVFLALSDAALGQTARRPWPGKDAVLRRAAELNVRPSRLKGFVADEYGLLVDEARCRYAAELTRQAGNPPWVADLLRAVAPSAADSGPLRPNS